MTLSLSAAFALAAQCAPAVSPQTLLSVVHTESRFDPLAIGVNGGRNPPVMRDRALAAQVARRYIAAGYSIDLGIAQINSANLAWLGLSVEEAFDPCRNLAAAARILATNYAAAARRHVGGTALGVALSMYNTGSERRGFQNGYVTRVYRSAATLVPAISAVSQVSDGARETSSSTTRAVDPMSARSATPSGAAALDPPVTPDMTSLPQPAAWDVFAVARTSSVMIFKGVGR